MATVPFPKITHKLAKACHELPVCFLKIFYANVRSILNEDKLKALKDELRHMPDVDVIILTETWIATEDQAKRAEIDSYKHYFNTRDGKKGGGVTIYVKTHLRPKVTVKKFHGGVNFLWVRLRSKAIDIGAIYKPSNADVDTFLREYSKQLKQMAQAIVFGDFNINLLESNNKTSNYQSVLADAGFSLLNRKDPEYATRRERESKTIIDHASSNLNDREHTYCLHLINSTSLSDHNQLFLEVTKITPSEDDRSPRNKKRRTHSNDDTRQKRNDKGRADKEASEANEASEAKNNHGTPSSSANAAGNENWDRFNKIFNCPHCAKLYVKPICFQKHLIGVHNVPARICDENIMWKCPYCGLSCKRKAYNIHVTKCLERPNKYKSSCESSISTINSVRDNEVKDGDDNGQESSSSEDGGSEDDKSSRSDDDSSSSDGESYDSKGTKTAVRSCPICTCIFDSFASFFNHVANYHTSSISEKSNDIPCPRSNVLIEANFLEHSREHEPDGTEVVCGDIATGINNNDGNVNITDATQQQINEVSCPLCNVRLTEANFLEHSREHEPDDTEVVCGDIATGINNNDGNVNITDATQQQINEVSCPLCNVRLTEANFLEHSREHEPDDT